MLPHIVVAESKQDPLILLSEASLRVIIGLRRLFGLIPALYKYAKCK